MTARALFFALMMGLSIAVGAQTSTFTYQGYLTEAGAAAEGAFDFELALYNVDSAGTAIDVNGFDDVAVTGGLFQLAADFTSAPFEAGGSYWVEARVRDGADAGAYTPLLPRQPVNASPYAIAAQAVIAPLDVAGDANIQGILTVDGDIRTVNEVRAQRIEADEIWSDGPVDLLGGTVIQRFGDSVALVVSNAGPTQPAARVDGDVEVGGQLRCEDPGGCVAESALAFPVYARRDAIDWREEEKLIISQATVAVTATCAQPDDLLLFGACPSGGFNRISLVGSNILNRLDSLAPLGYTCRYENDFSSSVQVTTIAACLPQSP